MVGLVVGIGSGQVVQQIALGVIGQRDIVHRRLVQAIGLVGGRAVGTLGPRGDNPIRVLTGWLPFTSGRQMNSSLQDPAYRDLVRHLVALRRGAGVTQSALADRLSKPQSWVSKSERFERRIDVLEFAQVV